MRTNERTNPFFARTEGGEHQTTNQRLACFHAWGALCFLCVAVVYVCVPPPHPVSVAFGNTFTCRKTTNFLTLSQQCHRRHDQLDHRIQHLQLVVCNRPANSIMVVVVAMGRTSPPSLWTAALTWLFFAASLVQECATAAHSNVDVALQIKPEPSTGLSSVGFKVQEQNAFAFISARGNLELGTGNRTLLHISGPDSTGNKSLVRVKGRPLGSVR